MNNFYIIKYIFLNRFRKLTYLDSGPFYFFGLLYLISIYQLYFLKSEYSDKLVLFMFFLQNISFLQREDFVFLRKQMSIKNALFIITIDLLLLSLPLLIFTFFKAPSFFLIEIIALLTLPLTLLLKRRNGFKINLFSSKDALWNSYIRKKPWSLLLLLVVYYVQFQALLIHNNGLFHVVTCGILLFTLNIYLEKEYFIYLKLSSKNLEKYLAYLLIINIKNIFYISIPSILILIFYGIENIYKFLLIVFSGSLLFWERYLFADKPILKNFIGLITIILVASIYNFEEKLSLILLVVILINILLLKITPNRLTIFLNRIKE